MQTVFGLAVTEELVAGASAVALATLVGVLAALALHYRRRWTAAERRVMRAEQRAVLAETTLASAPLGCLAFWHADEKIYGSASLLEALGLTASKKAALKIVLGAFESAAAERLGDAIKHLRDDGTGFAMTLQRKDGERTFEVTGARAQAAIGPAVADLVWFEDVTSLTRARDQAAAESGKMAGMLDALPMPIWRRDGDLNLTYCNRAYAQAVDEEPVSAMTKAVELLGKAKSDAGRSIGMRALASGAAVAEGHHVVVGGARRFMAIEEQPLGDGTLVGHAIDRTDAEEMQAELARHLAAHDDVLENLGSAVAILGPDMRLRFFNTAYARLWHLEESFLSTAPEMGDILEALREARRLPEHANFPEFKREWIRGLKSLIEPVESLLHLPDGSTLRSIANAHPFGGVLLIYEDVTDRLTLERSYNTLIEVQRETLDNLYEGVSVYGADGRLKLSNPAFARIWDLPADLLAGQPHVRELVEHTRQFFEISDEKWAERSEVRVARTTEPEARSGRRERTDGTVIDWTQMPLPDGASLFTFLDVTDSIRVERALLERNEALETADRLKSEFVANISYELRTPLNAIVGFAEILENQFFGPLNERQLEYSHGIVEASQRLIALINDILDLATIEAGYLQLDVTPVDIRTLLENLQTVSHERAYNRNLSLKVYCPDDIGTVMADGRRLRQALYNLLSNAFKYTPEGGIVTASAKREESEVLLMVSDTGAGMRAEDVARIFGKFERANNQSGQSGAGLGLSLVKSLIELHGGWVELDSQPDKGTRVTCHIPIDRPEAQPKADEEPKRA